MRGKAAGIALAAGLTLACRKPAAGTSAPEADPFAAARSLVEQGQYDEALAQLQNATEPEALYLQGRAWAAKGEKAPLPTPAPGTSVAPEWKPEEIRALDLLERAIAARPDLAGAHVTLAQVLTPHALVRAEREAAAAARVRGKKGRPPAETPPPPMVGPDSSPERVVRELKAAAQAEPASKVAVEALIAFATRAGRLDEAEAGYQELLKREREKPEPFVRYGDFLLGDKKDPQGAIEQYRQALIWRPDDDATKAKVADIYITMARQHIDNREYATAEARMREAEKYITPNATAQAQRLQEQEAFLAQIRGRSPGR
jgi:tetratricopeptide (TPR) repeat protein